MKCGQEEIDVFLVDPGLRVRDERDGQLIDARVASEWAARELRQLTVIAARQTFAHLEDVLAYDMKVVEEPVPRWADVDLVSSDGGESSVRLFQNPASFGEPGKQLGATTLNDREALTSRHRRDALRELLGTQQLAADRTGKQPVHDRAGPRWRSRAQAA